MSTATVARSASVSLTEVFGVISTSANALTLAVDSLGQAAKVGNMHAKRWADRTRKTMAIESADEDIILVREAAARTTQRLHETHEFLKRNPELQSDYDKLVEKYTSALKAAE